MQSVFYAPLKTLLSLLSTAKRGLPECIECKCKQTLTKPEPFNFNTTYRPLYPNWGKVGREMVYLRDRQPDQRQHLWYTPERVLPWLYIYHEYPELEMDDFDYEDTKLGLKVSQVNASRLQNPFYKAHTPFQVRRNVNWI